MPELVPLFQASSPLLESSYISRLTFFWLHRLIWVGYRKPLEQSDLFELTEENTSAIVVKRWEKNWEDSKDKAAK